MGASTDIKAIKAFRRQRLSELLDRHSKMELGRMVDISPDYLWQMGKGTGKSARGVNDENARKIESKLGQPMGWMDGPAEPISLHDATVIHPSPHQVQRVRVRGAAMVGEDGFWQELDDVGGAYVEWRTRHGDEYAIEIKSDRFHPEIRRGALVIFSPSKALAFNEYALVKLRDGRSTILEFLRQEGDLYTFTALQSGGRRVSLEASGIEHVHAYAGMAPASDKQTD